MADERGRSTAEIGTTGLKRWSGRITEEYLPELQGQRGVRAYEELRRSDPVIGAVLRATKDTICGLQWTAEPADDSPEAAEWATFVDQCRGDMSHSWPDWMSEVMSVLPFGWSYFNQVYKVRAGPDADPPSSYDDGRIGWRKFSLRKQDSLDEWAFDANGGIQGMWQRAAPNYQRVLVPIAESILFRVDAEGNNPEGSSYLRACYRPGVYKRNLEEIEAIGIERDFTGLMHIELPHGASEQDRAAALDILERVKVDDQAGIATTKGADPQGRDDWTISLLTAPGRKQIDIDKAIQRYASEIATAFLAQFLRLGQNTAVGSYALSTSLLQFFYVSIQGLADGIEETINRYAVSKLMRLNGVPRPLWPHLTHGRIARREMTPFMEAIKILVEAGLMGPVDGALVNFFRRELEMPEVDEDEYDNAAENEDTGEEAPDLTVAATESRGKRRKARWYPLTEGDLRGWLAPTGNGAH